MPPLWLGKTAGRTPAAGRATAAGLAPAAGRATPAGRAPAAVLIAGGPSLTQADVDYCRGKARVLAINDTYRMAPWADLLYFCDGRWWDWHKDRPAFKSFAGIRATLDQRAAETDHGLKWLKNTGPKGLETDPTGLRTGRNSGYQAINLAVHLGAKRIVLLGYDMRLVDGSDHWFGSHPDGRALTANHFTNIFLPAFKTLVEPLAKRGVEVVNATPGSALTVFDLHELIGVFE